MKTTRSRAILAVAAVALAAGAASAFRSPGGGSQPAAPRAERAALRADVRRIEPSAVRDVVRTTGTLAANESVEIVSELSRRLVAAPVAEGTQVEAGAVLFKLDDADLRAELRKLEAQRELAAATEQRQRELIAKNALSQQQYDTAVTQLRVVQADIAAMRVTLDKTQIRAPFAGRVGLRRVSEGAWVTPSTPLTTLQDTRRMKVDFTLPERHAGSVAIGQRFEFQVAGRGESFAGQVVALEPQLDAATRSLVVRGISENPGGALVPGGFAAVELAISRPQTGLLVPAEAIVPTASGQGVYVLREGKAELAPVQVGLRTQDSVEILRGLSPGDTVITSNLLRIRPGSPVEPSQPVAAPSRAADEPVQPKEAPGA